MHFGRLLLRSACGRRCPVVPSLLTSSIRNAASRDYSSSSSFVPNERRLLTRLQDPAVASARGFADEADKFVVNYSEFKSCLGHQTYFVVDVREPEELVGDGKLIGAVNIPLGKVDTEFAQSPNEIRNKYHLWKIDDGGRNIIFFCRAGVRAQKAMHIAHKHGFTEARFYKGSFNDWIAKGGPIVKE